MYSSTIEDVAKKVHLANINTLLIFTSQDSLNTGRYNFTNVGVDMDIYNLPFTYDLDSSNDTIDYFIVGNIGYSRVFISKNIIIPPDTRLNHENHTRTYIGGIGGGIRYKASSELNFSGGIEFIYSKSGTSVSQPDDSIGDAIKDFFNQEYNDNISYKLFATAQYRPIYKNFKPYAKLDYKLYQTKSSFSFDELTTFHTDSTVVSLALGAETDKLLSYDENYLTLEGYVNASYLHGKAKEVVEFDLYTSVGAVAYLYTLNHIAWIERFFFEINTVRADGLNGYNIGVGFSINY